MFVYVLGTFYKKPLQEIKPGERPKPIRHEDNLRPEGEFTKRPTQDSPLKGERADVKRPTDNLKMEGCAKILFV